MEVVPLQDRMVEVIADLGESTHPRYRYGSGCIVLGGTVLTAAHVVAGARDVKVRDPSKVLHPATLDQRFVGDPDGPGPDLALVTLTSPTVDLPPIPLAMVNRASTDAEPVERCQAIGYPEFAKRLMRDTADAFGYVPVLSNLVSGLLSLYVSGPPRPLPPGSVSLGKSEWSGMSGAPVVAAGCLLGVVTEHAAREPSTITITPLTALEPDPAHPGWGPGVTDAASWWARLGVAGLAALTRLPHQRVRREPVYRAVVRDIQNRTRELRGRKRELSERAAFATSSEEYQWLAGGAWTGKTALLAASVAALPDEVQVVAYFLSRVQTEADSNRFLGAVVPQLADLLDEDPPVADRYQFRALWERACSAAAAANRHLLLVVDGLDEDLHPPGSPSVASLLPTMAGGRAHVLVSSRPYLELPSDIPVGHPLLSTTKTELEPFEGAAEQAALARQEIDDLKRRDDAGLATDVFAVLTAAAGPLAIEDLATLTTDVRPVTPAHTRGVRRLVTEDAARSLEPVGSPTTRRYQFAHPSLLEYAETDSDLTDPEYRQRVYRWAEGWAAAGWPAGTESAAATPRYLLEAYAATLAGDSKHPAGREDLERLAALVTNIGWVDSAVALVGVDAVLASLRTAAQATSGRASVSSTLRVLEREAHHLRPPYPCQQSGYPARQIAFDAVATGDSQTADQARSYIEGLTPPQLIPQWSTSQSSAALTWTLTGHQGAGQGVTAVAVSADGRLVVSGGVDRTVRIWDTATGTQLGAPPLTSGEDVRAVAISADGHLAVSAGDDGTLRIWDTAAGTQVGVIPEAGGVRAAAVSADGHRAVFAGEDGTVRIWDVAAGTQLGAPLTSGEDVRAVAISADGRLAVSAGNRLGESSAGFRVYDGTLRIWDTAAGTQLGAPLIGHRRAVSAVAVSADGRFLVSGGDDRTVRIWDLSTATEGGARLTGHQGEVHAVALRADGRLAVSGGEDGTVRIWDMATGTQLGAPLTGHQGEVYAVAVSADGRLAVSGGEDGTVRIWETATGTQLGAPLTGHQGEVHAVAVSADGRLALSGGVDGTVRMWETATGAQVVVPLTGHRNGVSAVALSADGRLAVCGRDDGTVRILDTATGTQVGVPHSRQLAWVPAVAVSADGRLAVSGGDDGTVRIWDTATGTQLGTPLDGHRDTVFAVAVSADGRLALSGGSDGSIRVWDVPKAQCMLQTVGDAGVTSVAIARLTQPGVRLVAGHTSGALTSWILNMAAETTPVP